MPRYFIGTLLYFWLPVAIMSLLMKGKWPPLALKSFWISLAILTPATFAMEYVFLWTDIWTFSEELDPLLGIYIFGVPVEEFSFWFGASPFILLSYLLFCRLFPRKPINHA